MEEVKNPSIKLVDNLTLKDYGEITKLQKLCLEQDKTTLKLELDYKLRRAEGKGEVLNRINEFMYYEENLLVGYIGLCQFGKSIVEVNGMVHPQYRRRGVFKKLFSLVVDEWKKRESRELLLLSDRNSTSGQEFIRSTPANYSHSEFEMFLKNKPKQNLIGNDDVILRKATNKDAKEIAWQNSIYFEIEYTGEIIIMPEEEEKCGTSIYLAEVDNKSIGKIHIEISEGVGGIYGFGVLPEYRRKGYGRKILTKAIEELKKKNLKDIMLQVETKNSKALDLYTSCGFEVTSSMDYYVMSKE